VVSSRMPSRCADRLVEFMLRTPAEPVACQSGAIWKGHKFPDEPMRSWDAVCRAMNVDDGLTGPDGLPIVEREGTLPFPKSLPLSQFDFPALLNHAGARLRTITSTTLGSRRSSSFRVVWIRR
jgi:hypothetical protein